MVVMSANVKLAFSVTMRMDEWFCGAGGSCWDSQKYGIYEKNRIRGRIVATDA